MASNDGTANNPNNRTDAGTRGSDDDVHMFPVNGSLTNSDNESSMFDDGELHQNQFHFVGGMFPHGHGPHEPLDVHLRCYSSFSGDAEGQTGPSLDNGGKFILPPSVLNQLTRLNITYPMLFHVTNVSNGRDSYCGVLEFIAPEGRCFAPKWMMKNLGLEEGSFVNLTNAALPTATYAKFEPQSVDFLEISDQRAVLENALRFFATLTTGDLIGITYNDQLYELRVLETRPQRAVCCIECDMSVDFAPPVGYVEPQRRIQAQDTTNTGVGPAGTLPSGPNGTPRFLAFSGAGCRLDGKPFTASTSELSSSANALTFRGIPDRDWKFGKLNFSHPNPNSMQHED